MVDMTNSRVVFVCLLTVLFTAGCGYTITDPAASLRDTGRSTGEHRMALQMLVAAPGEPTASDVDAVQGLAYRSGYSEKLRLEGLAYLLRVNREVLVITLRRRLPRVTDHDWLIRLCQFVAENDITELDEALVSSWGRPWKYGMPDTERPEYLALLAMHGSGKPEEIVWKTFREAKRPSESGLRYRCWDLLHRLDRRDQLIALVLAEPTDTPHPMQQGLHAAAVSFGTVPWNREEVLWIEKLGDPSRAAFWSSAESACNGLSPERRASLEIRHLSVVTAAAQSQPDLLTTNSDDLYAGVAKRLAGQRHYREVAPGFEPGHELNHRLSAQRDRLSWGDLLAIQIAQEAISLPEVRSHLFDFGDRDLEDETTEYGGVIALDDTGRFAVREFPPRIRIHDARFEASQEMFDAGYTALFHFHYHAQKYRNGSHAGPGAGDMKYANATRTNCLVLTFVDHDTLNVDFYRHDGVLVDLGVIVRPSGRG